MACQDTVQPRPFSDPARIARLFWAVACGGAARDFLVAEQQRLAGLPVLARARWLAPAHWHMTLFFAGDTEVRTGLAMADTLRQVAAGLPAFSTSLQAADWFPALEHPLVVAAGVAGTPALQQLVGAVEDVARAVGMTVAARPFRGHVTLARLPRRFRPRDALPASASPASLPVDHLALYESVATPAGRDYRIVLRLPLAGTVQASSTRPA